MTNQENFMGKCSWKLLHYSKRFIRVHLQVKWFLKYVVYKESDLWFPKLTNGSSINHVVKFLGIYCHFYRIRLMLKMVIWLTPPPPSTVHVVYVWSPVGVHSLKIFCTADDRCIIPLPGAARKSIHSNYIYSLELYESLRVVWYGHGTAILWAFRICKIFKAGPTNKVCRLI